MGLIVLKIVLKIFLKIVLKINCIRFSVYRCLGRICIVSSSKGGASKHFDAHAFRRMHHHSENRRNRNVLHHRPSRNKSESKGRGRNRPWTIWLEPRRRLPGDRKTCGGSTRQSSRNRSASWTNTRKTCERRQKLPGAK